MKPRPCHVKGFRNRQNAILKGLANANLSDAYLSNDSDRFEGTVRRVMEGLAANGVLTGWGVKRKDQKWFIGWSIVANKPTIWLELPMNFLFPGGFDVVEVMSS